MEDSLFDKILRGEIPSDCVYEDEFVYAFRDIAPKAPVHVLVIPKKKICRFSELKEQSASFTADFIQGVSRVAAELGLDDKGYRVVFNNGPDGGQEVEYIHAHILGGKALSWPKL